MSELATSRVYSQGNSWVCSNFQRLSTGPQAFCPVMWVAEMTGKRPVRISCDSGMKKAQGSAHSALTRGT